MCDYTLIAHEESKPGQFMNVTEVLAALSLEVLDAQIMTRKDGLVVDTFFVNDPDYHGQPPPRRVERVIQSILDAVKGSGGVSCGMRLDQVVDVCYVTNARGEKVLDPEECSGFQDSIQKAVDVFLDQAR